MKYLVLVLAIVGCRSDYGLTDAPEQRVAEPPAQAETPTKLPSEASGSAEREAPIHLERVDLSKDGSAATFAREDRVHKVREERFAVGGGAATPVADYLFVVDHSVSMGKVLDKVRAGMSSLAEEGAFPAKARIAVMSTLPGDPADLAKPHPSAIRTAGIAKDPGFLKLVDAEGIAAYRKAAPIPVAERFALAGCDAWFAPTDTNDEGVPCLLAHTQIGQTGVGVEAGLVAFGQLMDRAEEPVFRPGAAVNVIFVSDTHDPGIPLDAHGAADLGELRPDFEQLREAVEANGLVASFRVHAIAPNAPCVEKWADGPTYREAAEAADGVVLDVCTASDYRGLIRKIARTGAVVQRPVFPLGRSADEVESVEVDGVPVPFSISADRRVLVLDDKPARKRSKVAVRYRWR